MIGALLPAILGLTAPGTSNSSAASLPAAVVQPDSSAAAQVNKTAHFKEDNSVATWLVSAQQDRNLLQDQWARICFGPHFCGCIYTTFASSGPNAGMSCAYAFGYDQPTPLDPSEPVAAGCTSDKRPFSCESFLNYGCPSAAHGGAGGGAAKCTETKYDAITNKQGVIDGSSMLNLSCGAAWSATYLVPGLACASPPPSSPPPSPASPPQPPRADNACFAKESAFACRLIAPEATPERAYHSCYDEPNGAAERVPMGHLARGDFVLTLTTDGAARLSSVLVNQHASAAVTAPLITIHTNQGAALTLTADHAIFVDGALAAASAAIVGSKLITARGEAVVTKVTTATAASVVNPVTAAGTILASAAVGAPILAASHPIHFAPLLLASPTALAFANAALLLVGDSIEYASAATFCGIAAVKLAATLVVGRLVARLVRGGKS